MTRKVVLSKETLRDLYLGGGLTTYQIADRIGCCQATVWKRLHAFGIPIRARYRVPLTKEQLAEWYLNQKLSTWEIEKRFGIGRGTAHRKLREWNIPTRDIALSHLADKTPFSGSLTEKAYLIGFRIGDLNVKTYGPQSRSFQIKGGTTIGVQAWLFEHLFGPYSKVWTKKTASGKINQQAGLDESFSFLLSKNAPTWVFETPESFFAFLAGFTDAEGSILICNGAAYFAVCNTDRKLLVKLRRGLQKFGIVVPKIYRAQMTGYVDKSGYGHNSDLFALRCHKKMRLLDLLGRLAPFLRHPNKVKDLKRAMANILERNQQFGIHERSI